MKFKSMNIEFGDGYRMVVRAQEKNYIANIYDNEQEVGFVSFVTDYVDVGCITSIRIDEEVAGHRFASSHTLGEAVIKFFIKFPSIVRKPEFRFIFDAPDHLFGIINQYHFDRGENSSIENEIMIRPKPKLLEPYPIPDDLKIIDNSSGLDYEKLLLLLKKNAYWQENLTMARLSILVDSSWCWLVYKDSELVAFARVLTDFDSFASLWDVVVEEKYRGQGIGVALMQKLFSNSRLSSIQNWILFTDTAKGLYEKFGFTSIVDIPTRTVVHKLRLQEQYPDYMSSLIEMFEQKYLPTHMTSKQTQDYLFSDDGRRKKLCCFWKNIREVVEEQRPSIVRKQNVKSL